MNDFMICDLNINKIVLACIVKAGKGARVHHNRPSHGLALFLGGKRFLSFDRTKLTVEGDSIVYFPKGSNYTVSDIEPSDCYAINFDFDNPQTFDPFVIKIEHASDYLSNFKTAKNIWNSRGVSYQMKIKSELYDIIYKLHNEYMKSASRSNRASILPAIDFINNNFRTQSISIPMLADLCGFSEVYLRKMFLKEFGISPNKYIKRLRLEYAEQLLMSGMYTVNEVCYSSGFNDESYFNREFKKHFGHPPKAYVKASMN